METTHELAVQIVLDVLALREPAPGDAPFRMYTADIGERRVSLAKRFARCVPAGTGVADVHRVAAAIVPLLPPGARSS